MWLALKLVSLHYQIQLLPKFSTRVNVVISFKISIFALSNTTTTLYKRRREALWLALKLVSLHYQIQLTIKQIKRKTVVISFKISIFALSNTTHTNDIAMARRLWLALKLVSLHYQIQLVVELLSTSSCCD